MTIVILNPSSAAIIAIVFGEYMCRIIYHTAFSGSSEESAQQIPRIAVKLMAMLAVGIISAMHAISLKLGTHSQVALTVAKMAALVAVAVMAVVALAQGKQSTSLTSNIFEGSSHSPGRYALALYSGLWAFSGWAEACVVAGEMKEVERDLPKAIHISMGITTLLYLLANVGELFQSLQEKNGYLLNSHSLQAYFVVLPKTMVAHSNTVGLDFGKEMFGPIGGVVFALIVAMSCFGALNGWVQWRFFVCNKVDIDCFPPFHSQLTLHFGTISVSGGKRRLYSRDVRQTPSYAKNTCSCSRSSRSHLICVRAIKLNLKGNSPAADTSDQKLHRGRRLCITYKFCKHSCLALLLPNCSWPHHSSSTRTQLTEVSEVYLSSPMFAYNRTKCFFTLQTIQNVASHTDNILLRGFIPAIHASLLCATCCIGSVWFHCGWLSGLLTHSSTPISKVKYRGSGRSSTSNADWYESTFLAIKCS